jgi:adenosylhomocysteine nucleosidase
MPTACRFLITFAVIEECRPFHKAVSAPDNVAVLVTGIGPRNAEKAIRTAFAARQPDVVLTCGFAGGLNPELPTGTVVFSADSESGLSPALLSAGARAVKFHCADRVVATAKEKKALRQSTDADAVEMESGIIRAFCREQKIPSATVRVISDSAKEDLPLDFNRLLDAEQNLRYGRLVLMLLASPGKIGALLGFQKQTKAAADGLAETLKKVISAQAQVRS